MNVDRVDLPGIGAGHAPGNGGPRDLVVEPRALERGHGLGITDARDVALGIEHHGSGHDGAGEAAPPDLVDAGDQVEAQPTDRILERPESADSDHGRVAVRSDGLLLRRVFHARRLALQLAQEVQLRAPDPRGADHVDLVDDRRMQREDALDALPE